MYKSLFSLTASIAILFASPAFAYFESITSFFSSCCPGADCSSSCCYSLEFDGGWRRDNLEWKVDDLHSSHVSADVNDRILFKEINSYTVSGQAKWVSSNCYIRLSGEYGWTDKGRAHEHFKIKSPYLYGPVKVNINDPIKRRSEVYDFDGAIGYPFAFFNCRLSVIPLIGFSFHRQHLRVKTDEHSSSHCSYDRHARNHKQFFKDHSSSSFFVSSDHHFVGSPSSNPFSSSSDSNIASEIGLYNPHRTNNYRVTWYGFYLGADMAYATDGCWTLFWNTELHFLDNCDRKRKSWTGVYFVDDYHKKGFAYGFNNFVGATCYLCNNWYATASVDFDWWKAHSKHDELHWNKVGAKLGLIASF